MYEVINEISRWAIPLMLLLIPLAAFFKKVPVFETFVEGAEAGFSTAIKTIPFLTAMLVAVSVFRASGAMELLTSTLSTLLDVVGIPAEIIPHAIMRPLSGGAALGIATELIKTHGPDSFVGRLVSTMQGSSDTTFYVLTLYFGSVGIRKYRYAVASGLAADFTTLVASILICHMMF
ncbi:spore maturation protein [Desulforamulus ruminis]|uniref:Nucleoside recognition domain protein n=1 Tax=Desulforamulus ruminis (strain ATCC 23193 / DSM 2154 / NCIMB 8452 / DL) TaxID=696281 RepID=F6DT73_DESRL|nr:nucleoside recognition domain-containing protein [Desulforamulus ruminis]AEG61178.1 nucleoside recognition domain protein [Desulforamulus ruminis DSM 2154]